MSIGIVGSIQRTQSTYKKIKKDTSLILGHASAFGHSWYLLLLLKPLVLPPLGWPEYL